jgi:hypothetical protein
MVSRTTPLNPTRPASTADSKSARTRFTRNAISLSASLRSYASLIVSKTQYTSSRPTKYDPGECFLRVSSLRYLLDTFNIYYEASFHGRYCRRKLCQPPHVSLTVSRSRSFTRRMLSFTIRSRFTPPLACSLRMRMAESRRVVACSGGVRSSPRGCFVGWTIVTPARTNPWKPSS